MTSPTPDDSNDASTKPIGYRTPGVEVPQTPRAEAVRFAAQALAVAWSFIALASGVASDRIRLSQPKKIAISLSACIVITLLVVTSTRHKYGCATTFVIVAFWIVAVMWFWN
jgi:hypothetical protein